MAFVEESDIGTYGLRVFNQFGEAYCEAALVYDGLEVRPGQSLGDCYQGKFILSIKIEHELDMLEKKSLGFCFSIKGKQCLHSQTQITNNFEVEMLRLKKHFNVR